MPLDEMIKPHTQLAKIMHHDDLVIQIALFLNFLSKKKYQNLTKELAARQISSEGEILKFMVTKRYIKLRDVKELRKIYLNFSQAQEDLRFGSLCIQFEFLTQGNMNLALDEQKSLARSGNNLLLGEMLVEAGMLSHSQQKLILEKQEWENNNKKKNDFLPLNSLSIDQEAQIPSMGIVIGITDDGLKATLLKTDEFDKKTLLSDLKQLIETNGIIYGVVDDDKLKEFLANDEYKKNPFDLAGGLSPEKGDDARIYYFFERKYLKAGMLSTDGSIDFKNRGDAPFVKADSLLAEKIPSKIGRDGVNIFGNVVPAILPADRNINCGTSVRLSKNNRRAFARISGFPRLAQGELTVDEAYVIEGDVDYTTGHIKFDKNIFITGTIKNGFKVQGINVTAKSIDGGIIKAGGNVFIKDGIKDASIDAKGNMSAGFIHRSEIVCMGDMEVQKEVVETQVATEGKFEMLGGTMYASSLSARGGARIKHIGSQKTRPVNISVGTSPHLEKRLNELNNLLEETQTRLEKTVLEKDKKEKDQADIIKRLRRLEQSRQKYIMPFEDELKEGPTHSHLDTKTELEMINQEMETLYTLKKQLNQERALLELKVTFFSNLVKKHVAKKFDLYKCNQTNPGKPILDVTGNLLAGTQINGKNAKLLIQNDIALVKIMEVFSSREQESTKGWDMVVEKLYSETKRS
jgi:uncharacterized protein (DUF342 family)